jgi:hypothetical protein
LLRQRSSLKIISDETHPIIKVFLIRLRWGRFETGPYKYL